MTDTLNRDRRVPTDGELSRALDAWARAQPGRTPLSADPALWDALEPDRQARRAPRPYVRHYPGMVCRGECGRTLRLRGELAADHPGTVRAYALGCCTRCYRQAAG